MSDPTYMRVVAGLFLAGYIAVVLDEGRRKRRARSEEERRKREKAAKTPKA